MKYISAYLIFFAVLTCLFSFQNIVKEPLSYKTGEKLVYRVHYGLINAGEAKIETSDKLYMVNQKVCHKAVCSGRTTGAFDLMMRVRDTWGSYVDTVSQLPQKGYRDIQEGKYRLKEATLFDYKNEAVTVEKENDKKVSATYKITKNTQDIVSGLYFLRNVDFNKLSIGDTLKLDAFLEDKLYIFKIKYWGKGEVDTKFGKIKCLKMSPIMDKNGLFEDGNSIRFWLSDDLNKIPVRIEADMFVGQVAMDLKEYKGLKYPIQFR